MRAHRSALPQALRADANAGFAGDELHRPLLRISRVHLQDGELRIPRRHAAHDDAEHSAAAADAGRVGHARGRDDGLAALLVHALHDGNRLRSPGEESPWRTSSTEITAGSYCSSRGTENRSCAFCTVMPIVVVSPGFTETLAGSKPNARRRPLEAPRRAAPGAAGAGAAAPAAAAARGAGSCRGGLPEAS